MTIKNLAKHIFGMSFNLTDLEKILEKNVVTKQEAVEFAMEVRNYASVFSDEEIREGIESSLNKFLKEYRKEVKG